VTRGLEVLEYVARTLEIKLYPNPATFNNSRLSDLDISRAVDPYKCDYKTQR